MERRFFSAWSSTDILSARATITQLTDTPLPNKSLGQHFLIDDRLVDRIVQLADIRPTDHVLEIGSGTGRLTRQLLKKTRYVTAVEVDHRLVGWLRNDLSRSPGTEFKLIEADILKLSWGSLLSQQKRAKIVANLPYNIATRIIRKMTRLGQRFQSATLMLQKDVAMRLLAQPSTPDYGYFTLLTRFFFETHRGFDIQPGCFHPPPKVLSHVLRLQPVSADRSQEEWQQLNYWLLRAFQHPRKTLRNNLKQSLPQQLDRALAKCRIPPRSRPGQLSLEQYRCLARMLPF